MNKIKQSFLSGLVFSWTVLSSFLVYATWTDIATQNTGDTINATIWNNVVTKVNTIWNTYAPSWAIMAFYLSSCPTGWVAADGNNGTPNLKWEFIRGWDFNNSGVDNGRALWSSQNGTITYSYGNSNGWVPFAPFENMDNTSNVSLWTSYNISPGSPSWWGNTKWTTRPRNVALLYCMKQ